MNMDMKNSKGFTLLEVLIVVVIFGVGMAIAIPSIKSMGQRSAVMADARQLKDVLAQARMEAIEQNSWVTVEYRQGNDDYVVFVDSTPPDHSYAGTEELISTISLSSTRYDTAEGGGDGITIGMGAGNAVSWDAKGISYDSVGGLSNGSVFLRGDDGSGYRIIINQAGTVRIIKY